MLMSEETVSNGIFCTLVNCIDGRAQIPAIEYMKKRTGAQYVDCVTAPGANLALCENQDARAAMLAAVKISVEKHASSAIAVAGHYDCAANPTPGDEQAAHTKNAVEILKAAHPDAEVIGLWVDENWKVTEI